MEKVNITIVGAGVVGLAIAAELSKRHQDILIIERNPCFGQETSSRNSEVIHAGIYYPRDSLKARTCIEGREMLYEFCAQHNIPHKKTGKLIVAIDNNEVRDLEHLFRQGLANGADDLKILSKEEIRVIEPEIKVAAGIYSPSTGILDTHSFMKELALQFQSRGGLIAYNTELKGIDKAKDGFRVSAADRKEGSLQFSTRNFINCAGLNSDKVAQMIGIARSDYNLRYCKGDYFRVHNRKAKFINRLVYPVPKKAQGGLGIHVTLDLAGGLRLGPDDEYIEKIEYNIDKAKAKVFYESARKFLPFIQHEDLSPDIAGIRPKLQGQNEDFRDFIIKEEADNGLAGFINLIGIESPGLTASLSIAKLVAGKVKKI